MKFSLIILFFISFSVLSQEIINSVIPRAYSLSSSFQNEDIFVSLGAMYNVNNPISLEIRYGVGSRRTFSQQTLFSKMDVLVHYNFLKNARQQDGSGKWKFGPSVQFSMLRLTPKLFKPIQKYFTAELGYYLAYGKKLKVFQSSYFGYRSTQFEDNSKSYSYWGYALQIGTRYEF